jgi:SNARE associated Golgi protein
MIAWPVIIFSSVAVYAVATVLFIPASLLTLGSGFVFAVAYHGLGVGTCVGTVAVFVGGSIGALTSFVLARYLWHDSVRQLARRYTVLQALECALQQNGFKIFMLLRLSPVAPFNIISYFGGVSGVSFRDFALSVRTCVATTTKTLFPLPKRILSNTCLYRTSPFLSSLQLVAILPGTALYVFLGASAERLAADTMMEMGMLENGEADEEEEAGEHSVRNKKVTIGVIVAGVVLGVGAIALTTRYARRELRRILDEQRCCRGEQEDDEEEQQLPPTLSSPHPTAVDLPLTKPGSSRSSDHLTKTASSVDEESTGELVSCGDSDDDDDDAALSV